MPKKALAVKPVSLVHEVCLERRAGAADVVTVESFDTDGSMLERVDIPENLLPVALRDSVLNNLQIF